MNTQTLESELKIGRARPSRSAAVPSIFQNTRHSGTLQPYQVFDLIFNPALATRGSCREFQRAIK